jgi:hypothetical protein
MNTPKLIAIFLAVFTITSHAVGLDELKYTIEAYEGGGLSANISDNTVTVTGTKTGATSTLFLMIDPNVTVVWKAELTGNVGCSGNECYPLIFKGGRGLFEVQSGGRVAQTGAGYAISNGSDWNSSDWNNSFGDITISGGTVSATTGAAVYSYVLGHVTISGGMVSATTGTAVYIADGWGATISGGTVSATTGTAVFNNGRTLIVKGGTVTVGIGGTKYINYNDNNGKIIAWDNPSGSKTYTAFTSNDITKLPATATAVWLNKYGKAGIDYANGADIDFIELGVTVNRAKITNPTVTVNLAYTGSEQSAGIAINAAYTITGDIAATNVGSYTATVALKDKANYEWTNGTTTDLILPWSIAKATGLENIAPPHRYISAVNTNENTYELHLLALNKPDHGDLSYTPGTLENTDGILASGYPKLANGILTYKGSGKTSGIATQQITVTSENYQNITATITFEATAKEGVAISGITAQNSEYDGTSKKGYSGVATSGAYTGALLVEYAGTNHPKSTTPPTNAGEYTIKISVPDSATYYFGEWSDDFTIAKKKIAKPTVATNIVHTGSEQSAGIAANAAYTVTGDKQTAVGNYTATVALKDKANNEWTDGKTDDLLLPWEIKANTPILPQIASGGIRVQTTTNAIMLENLPRNTKIQVYSIQGKQIYSTNSGNSQILRIPVQTKGMYIVKAGNQMVRVAVK